MSHHTPPKFRAVAVVAALIALGCTATAPVATPDDQPSTSPSSGSASGPPLQSSPSASSADGDRALTESYASAVHGMSVSYPQGWNLRPATEPWFEGELTLESTFADVISNPSGYPFIAMASAALGEKSGLAWTETFLQSRPCGTSRAFRLDALQAQIVECEAGAHVVAADDSRGLVVWLYTSDQPSTEAVEWFIEMIDTIETEDLPSVQGSNGFSVPFTFELPGAPKFDFAAHSPGHHEVRVPEFAAGGQPSGIITQAIGGKRSDPCDAQSAELPIAAGPQAVIDYLRTVPGIEVTDETATSIAGLDAVQATVVGSGESSGCDGETYAWAESTEPFSAVPLEVPRRVIAVDVAGEHLVFTVYGEDGNPVWTPLADEILGSLEFTSQ
jgi:hypothetical protein